MDYRLENLHDSEFEKLVNTICQKILGFGIISFAAGADGGRDGKFTGVAQSYPTTNSPWSGKFIIQAKHTSKVDASCSDNEFEKIVEKEIVKLVKLKKDGEIDNYMLFTNRKYTGVVGVRLAKKIVDETGIENAVIIGKESINDTYLNPNKEIVRQYDLNKSHISFSFSNAEIKEVLIKFRQQILTSKSDIKIKSNNLKYDYSHISKTDKNKKNKLSQEYFDNNILGSSLQHFDKIGSFLSDPINTELKEYYFDTVNELNEIIT